MTRRLLLLLALLVSAGAATALPAGAQTDVPRGPPDPTITDGSAQRALNAARARWKRAKVGSYGYEVKRTCFCPYTGWSAVKVRRGVVSKPSPAAGSDLASVPRLFRVIQRAIDDEVCQLRVSYGARGVPVEAFMDRILLVADDEWGFEVRRFKRR